ncbi:hypothetical protein GCM10010441_19020 [Kitasatospora paracochleata]
MPGPEVEKSSSMPYAPPETLKKINATSASRRTRFGAGQRFSGWPSGIVVILTSGSMTSMTGRTGGVP